MKKTTWGITNTTGGITNKTEKMKKVNLNRKIKIDKI